MSGNVLTTLAPQWARSVDIETAYLTDIAASAISLAEDRRSLRGTPRRSMRVDLVGLSRAHSAQLQLQLLRRSHLVTPTPLYCDQSEVDDTSDVSNVFCDTTYRRFFGGHYAFVLKVSGGIVLKESYGKVLEVHPDKLVMESPLDEAPGIGDLVFPAIQGEIVLKNSGTSLTDHTLVSSITVTEVIGKLSLPRAETAYPPPGFQTHEGLPILDTGFLWSPGVSVGVDRGGRQYESGRGLITDVAGRRAQLSHDLRYLTDDRSSFWNLLRFFDSMKGRRHVFWLLDPLTVFEPLSFVSTTIIQIGGLARSLESAFLDYIGIELLDGTVVIRPISLVNLFSDPITVELSSPLPFAYSLSEVRRMTSAYKVRSSRDYFKEIWFSDRVCSSEIGTVEVLTESTVEVENVPITITLGTPSDIPDLHFWFSAHTNCYTQKNVPANAAQVKLQKATDPDSKFSKCYAVTHVTTKKKKFSVPYLYSFGTFPPLVYQMTKGTAFGRRAFTANTGSLTTPSNVTAFFLGDSLAADVSDFWSNVSGLTMFVVRQFKNGGVGTDSFIRKTGVIEWDTVAVRLYEDLSVPNPSKFILIPNQNFRDSAIHIWTLRWDPGVSARLYLDGVLFASAAFPVIDLPSSFGTVNMSLTDEIGGEEVNNKFFEVSCHKRAMTVAEMNLEGGYLAKVYDIPWNTIP